MDGQEFPHGPRQFIHSRMKHLQDPETHMGSAKRSSCVPELELHCLSIYEELLYVDLIWPKAHPPFEKNNS